MFGRKTPPVLTVKEAHYKYVLDEDYERYAKFKSELIYKTTLVKGHELRHTDVGSGPLLVMLPGSTGKALSFYEYIDAFSSDYRVIAVDYPVVASLNELKTLLLTFVEGLKEHSEKAYVIANSFGSVVLQEMLIESPDLFEKIFFIHSISKDEFISKKTVKLHQRSIKSFLKSVKFLNYEKFKKRFGNRIRKSINIYPDNISLRLFWEGFFEEMIYSTTQEEMISNYGFMKDFWEHRVYNKSMFEKVNHPVFIIEALRDMDAELPEKLALCALFANHELLILKGDANLSLVKNRDEITAFIVNKLLQTLS